MAKQTAVKRAAPASAPFSRDLPPKNYHLRDIIIVCVEGRHDDIVIGYAHAGLALGAGSVKVTATDSQQGRDGGIYLVERKGERVYFEEDYIARFQQSCKQGGHACACIRLEDTPAVPLTGQQHTYVWIYTIFSL